jgi:large subunit ribosomal protein L30
MSLLLVLNIHGKINSSVPVREALEELKVEKKFSATVVTDDAPTMGMLKRCKDYVAWAPVDLELLTTLLQKRGMVSTTLRLDADSLKTLGFKSHAELAEKMLKDKVRLSDVRGLRPFFRLSPPKGGFKRSLRRQYSEKGMLGSNPKLAELVGRMA